MLNHLIQSRYASVLLLFVLYWMVAAASVSGSVGKWALRDQNPGYGIEEVLDDRAKRPFAYRRLLPEAADLAERVVPGSVKAYVAAKLSPHLTFARATAAADPRYAFRYVVMVYACVAAALGALFVLTALLRKLGFNQQTAILAPVAFLLAFPFVQTVGGYYYDVVELFFLSAAALAAVYQRWIVLCMLAVPATLNKEAFFFFLPTLYPFLRTGMAPKAVLACLAAAIAVSGAVNTWIKWLYAAAPGDVAYFQLFNNLEKYLQPATYLELEVTYGVVGPSGAFIGTLLVLALLVLRAWPACVESVRRHVLIAALLNAPLFAAFCAPGELRNLSLLFVGFVVMLACVIENRRRPAAPQPVQQAAQANHTTASHTT